MNRKQTVYYTEMSPFIVLLLALLGLGAFFLTLPILIAALIVFGTMAAYMAWRFTKAMKQAQEEMLREQKRRTAAEQGAEGLIIDITTETAEHHSIEHGPHNN